MNKSPRRSLRAGLICAAMLAFSSCALLAQQGSQSSEPRILLFRILPTVIKGESWYEFHWEVIHTDRVKLYREGQEIPGRSQLADGSIGWPATMSGLRMKLKKMTTFELVARSRSGEPVRKKFTVKVASPERPQKRPPKERPPERPPKENPPPKERPPERPEERPPESPPQRPEKPPATETGTCTISGKLDGKWRQEIRERPTGPASTWTVKVYIYGADPNRPFAGATVSSNGTYTFEDLEAGENYKIKPGWTSTPEQGNISCSAGKTEQGPTFRITGSPRID